MISSFSGTKCNQMNFLIKMYCLEIKNDHDNNVLFQVPANRIGFSGNGGPFTLVQLKVIQEVVSISVFVIFTLLVFKTETFRINHLIGFVFLILAVFLIFKPN